MATTKLTKEEYEALMKDGAEGLSDSEIQQAVDYLNNLDGGDISTKIWKDSLALFNGKTGDEIEAFDPSSIYAMADKNPRLRNYARRQQIARGIEGGIETLKNLSNLSVGYRQKEKARELEAELQEPSSPSVTPKSVELEEATSSARRDLSAPIRDIDPILQQNIQNLRGNLGAAKTASTGQAGIYGSLSQNAFNQAQRANNALIPAIQNIRRQQKAEYNKLISAGISEDDMRFKQSMQKYDIANDNYIKEAQAVGALGAQANQNIYAGQNQLFNQMGSYVDPLINNNLFNQQTTKPVEGTSESKPYVMDNGAYNPNAEYGARATDYSAIGNLGGAYQDYKNKLDLNLGGWINGDYAMPNDYMSGFNQRYGFNK